ncbi:Ig-like domain-containing protein [Hymenobacter aquaticus]|nr:Ig-like domain-containing protein [Hymenobacter aquaticus]
MLSFFLLLFPGLTRVFAQAPNVTYQGPLVITQGGTYSGNYRSTDSNVPAISVQTTQPVIIENCIIASAGEMISAVTNGANLTVRNNRGYGLPPTKDNTPRGKFLNSHAAKMLRIENNYMEQTTGINVHTWSGDGSGGQTLTVRYNQAKNIDARYRNGGGTFADFIGLDKVSNLQGVDISWNQVINEPNNSLVGDIIAFYNSGGSASSPMRVHDNYVQGAYPYPATGSEFTGTGMIVDGDQTNTQGFIEAYNNHFVATCNSAMNIAGGHDIYYHHNRIVMAGLMPDGVTRLPSAYCGGAIFNYYGQGGFSNFKVDNQIIGYVHWGRNNPYANRQDEGDYGILIMTNTQHMPNPITPQTEKDEYNIWLGKVSQNGLKIGVGGSSTPTPTNVAPTVSLSVPTTGTVGTALTLNATAADADGSVAKVEFFNGATKLGEDTSAPYSLSFTPTAAATLSLTARATDNVGAATSTAVTSVTVTAATSGGGTGGSTGGTGTPTNATFFRALNVNGSATTVDGLTFEASSGAANVQIGGSPFANQTIALNPATDAARASMIRSSVYGNSYTATVGGVTNGAYQVYLYMWEDNNPVTFSISLEGQTAQSNLSSGSGGSWKRLGPFAANVADGNISIGITAANGGNANLSGIEIWKGSTTAPTNVAPTVSLTAPTTGTVGTALTLNATAADADGSVAKVEFFSGATKLGEDTSAPYSLSFTPTAAATLSLTARATDNAGATTTSSAQSVTVAGATASTRAFYRAININGSAMTLDGNSWQGSTATNYSIGGDLFANQNVTLNPATDATRASMIRSSAYGPSINFSMSAVPTGSYEVYLYVWEDDKAEIFNIAVNGVTAVSNFNSGSAGNWKKLGPFAANVTNGTISVTTSGGWGNLSGVEVWKK